jgi:Asp-tRNA(Asn)/Glu-tRNA(Gln) amidotransferase A subunit family amidase
VPLDWRVLKAHRVAVWLTFSLGADFDRSIYLGTPLCVQVVAPRLQEEKLVQAMSTIDDALKGSTRLDAKL